MENIREIIKENLIMLRKEHNFTQIELSKKINYSDKAISRWENGEVVPDIDILQSLSKVYGVSISYFFEEHMVYDAKNSQFGNKLAYAILVNCIIWTFLTILFVYLQIIRKINAYQVFVWGIPVSCLIFLVFNKKWFHSKNLTLILQSILTWTTILCFYLQFLPLNLWLIYLIGLPIQASIIVASFIKIN